MWKTIEFEPHSAQLQDLVVIHRALHHFPGAPRFLDITTGRQYGKTREAAVTVMEGLLMPPDEYGPPVVKIVADTYEHTNLIWDQVEAYIFGTSLKALVDTTKPGKGYDRERWIIYLKSGATVQKLSADRPQSLTGHTVTLAVIDEKAFVSDNALEMLYPCMAVRSGVVVAFGTAEGTGWGRAWNLKGQDDDYPAYWSTTHASEENPYLPLETIEQAREDLSDRRFRQLWLAQWVSEDGAVFHNIDGCTEKGWPQEVAPIEGKRYVMGLDLARYSDYTALIVADRETRRCVFRDRFNMSDWASQAARIESVAKRYNNARIWADTTHGSVGDVVAELLKKDYGLDVQGYPLTSSSKTPLIDRLVWSLEREELRFPDWKDLVNELILYEAITTPAGNVRLSAPSGYNDDLVIALALTNHGLRKAVPGSLNIPRNVGVWENM